MSAIYFHSPTKEVRLRGSERAHMGILCKNITFGAFGPTGWSDDPLSRVVELYKPSYSHFGGALEFLSDFKLFLGSYRSSFNLPDRKPETFDVSLNTVLAIGNDPMCLMARLHAQCEIHAWVDGPNRAWVANIIEEGRALGIMREDQGWEGLIDFLRENDSEPVVTSYSVTDSFPSRSVAKVSEQRWEYMADEEQWDMCMAKLRRKNKRNGLEIRPGQLRFPEIGFGTMDTAFTIMQEADKLRREEEARAAALSL